MPLSDYTGRHPRGTESTAQISRVVRHHHWDPSEDTSHPCANCGKDLSLRERHVLATLVEDRLGDASRRYLCNEQCVREWVGE
jgi:hypothetical protein